MVSTLACGLTDTLARAFLRVMGGDARRVQNAPLKGAENTYGDLPSLPALGIKTPSPAGLERPWEHAGTNRQADAWLRH